MHQLEPGKMDLLAHQIRHIFSWSQIEYIEETTRNFNADRRGEFIEEFFTFGIFPQVNYFIKKTNLVSYASECLYPCSKSLLVIVMGFL